MRKVVYLFWSGGGGGGGRVLNLIKGDQRHNTCTVTFRSRFLGALVLKGSQLKISGGLGTKGISAQGVSII